MGMLQIIIVLSMLGGAVYWIGDVFTDRVLAKQAAATKAAEEKRGKQNTDWVAYARKEGDAADARVKTAEAERDNFKAELDKRRPINVTPFAVNSCALTAGVVRQHNDAATGRAAIDLKPGAVFAVDAPAGVGIDRYSAVVENNYNTCHKWINRANEWQQQAAASCRKWNEVYKRQDACPPFPGATDGQPKVGSGQTETKGNTQ